MWLSPQPSPERTRHTAINPIPLEAPLSRKSSLAASPPQREKWESEIGQVVKVQNFPSKLCYKHQGILGAHAKIGRKKGSMNFEVCGKPSVGGAFFPTQLLWWHVSRKKRSLVAAASATVLLLPPRLLV